MQELVIQGIEICPVKSMLGIKVNEATLTSGGLKGDREFAVVDSAGETITRREKPALATFQASVQDNFLMIVAPDGECLKQNLSVLSSLKESSNIVQHFQHSSTAIDLGELASDWLTEKLGLTKNGSPLRLVQFKNHKATNIADYKGDSPPNAFLDRHPITATFSESLRLLNEKTTESIGMDCFRPNLVIAGVSSLVAACDEYNIKELQQVEDGFTLRNDGPIPRCGFVEVVPGTGDKQSGILKELTKMPQPTGHKPGAYFGICLSLLNAGVSEIKIKVGQRFKVPKSK